MAIVINVKQACIAGRPRLVLDFGHCAALVKHFQNIKGACWCAALAQLNIPFYCNHLDYLQKNLASLRFSITLIMAKKPFYAARRQRKHPVASCQYFINRCASNDIVKIPKEPTLRFCQNFCSIGTRCHRKILTMNKSVIIWCIWLKKSTVQRRINAR